MHIFLTASRRALRERLLPYGYEVDTLATAGLSKEERRILMSLLHRVRANFGPSSTVNLT